MFMTRFLLESVGDGFSQEFERSKQTESMSVSEYKTCLIELSMNAPHPIIEDMCVMWFIRGLKEYLTGFVVLDLIVLLCGGFELDTLD